MCITTLEKCKKELSYPTHENIIPVSLEILKKTTKKIRIADLRPIRIVCLPDVTQAIHFTITLHI